MLLGLVVLLLGMVTTLPVWFEYDTVQVLTKKVQKSEKEAREINALQSEIEEITQQTQHLLNEKNAAPSMLAMLNTLSSLMKDDTWLAYLHYADGRLQIQGQSPTASNLIAVLENSSVFSNPEFVSPVTQDSISKLENFEITVEPSKKAVPNVQHP
jgi:general secretion pathway protein L